MKRLILTTLILFLMLGSVYADDLKGGLDAVNRADYENPILEDLMAVCEDCHSFIHMRRVAPEFHPDSPAAKGDSGKTNKDESPGHWLVHTEGD